MNKLGGFQLTVMIGFLLVFLVFLTILVLAGIGGALPAIVTCTYSSGVTDTWMTMNSTHTALASVGISLYSVLPIIAFAVLGLFVYMTCIAWRK